MPTPHPHSPADLALAPVLIGIERNLDRLRTSEDLEFGFALELNDDGSSYTCSLDRAKRVRDFAVRDVELHGWQVQPSADMAGLAVRHGEYTVSLMLGRRLTSYVDNGIGLIASP
jgi:hypothetical protein